MKPQTEQDIEGLIQMLNEADKEAADGKSAKSKINFSDFPLDIQELVLDHMQQQADKEGGAIRLNKTDVV